MNINIFFSLLFISLVSIFVFFKPLNLKEQSYTDVPTFELSFFTLYELTGAGLSTLMTGDSSVKYEDRYIVSKIDYTDNSHNYIANMKANEGLYKNNTVLLTGDIVYIREDGLTFKTQKATYNKKSEIVTTKTPFKSFRAKNSADGSSLKYYNNSKKMEATDVTIKYNLKESL